MKKIAGVIVIVLLISCSDQVSIKFKLPAIINSGMVLQRNSEIVLWGNSKAGDKIVIESSWGARAKAKANREGKWQIKVPTGDAGGPYEIIFHSKDTSLTLRDILIGEVWLCSGQSNMEMPLMGWPPADTILNSAANIANANYPDVRLFTVDKATGMQPRNDCKGTWEICSPESAAFFSATAFFFGRKIHQELGVPVGLIHSSWGGTPAEAWTNADFLNEIPAYENIADTLIVVEKQFDEVMSWVNDLDNLPFDAVSMEYAKKALEDTLGLSTSEYDDSSWPAMPVPSFWERNELPNFDGIVWFRKQFEVPANLLNKELVLKLGPIDDMDVAYINNQKVGEILETGKWKVERNYTIPEGFLHKGINTLAVCVIDPRGGGGIYGSEDIKLESNTGDQIVLSGMWKYLPVAEKIGETVYYFTQEKPFTDRPELTYTLNQSTPTTLYNGMINPLVPYTLRGAIWYQGEANVGRGYEYRTLFPKMIANWRDSWGQGDFPFYYVQISPYQYGDEELSPAAEVREAQLMSLSVPNTGMVVTTDIGNPVNIHPANKQDVGERLALWALAKDYGYTKIEYSGPVYDSISISGKTITVHFKYTRGGLIAKGDRLTHFEIAGNDQQFVEAKAIINGETVEIMSDAVTEPVAVRFGWSAIAEPNLFNAAGLPASPFRTDSWKRLSE